MTHVCGWAKLWQDQITTSRKEYESAPEYPALVDEAKRRGFRPASLHELFEPGSFDARSWRGGVWVPIA